jgi:GT2 family glycosyltransferase
LDPAPARVSAIIVNYQSYAELGDCLASLEQSRDGSTAVIVVDHASETAAADSIASRFPQTRLVRADGNAGFAAGVNRGAREVPSAYLLLINPDCTIEPRLCERLADWMDAHPEVGAAGPRIRNVDGSVQASARRFPNFTTGLAGRSSWLTRVLPGNPLSRWNLPFDAAAHEPSEIDWVSFACVMIRRHAFEAVGGMDEGFFLYWEDADFCRRLKTAGWRTMYVPGVSAIHAGGRSSRHAADASLVAFHRSAYRLFWKHASPAGKLVAPFVFLALRARLAVMRHVVRARARRRQ